jgi:hypothetical protein
MRTVCSAFVCAAVVIVAPAAFGQPQITQSAPYEDYYRGPEAQFLHQSIVLIFAERPNQSSRYSIRDAICNFDPNGGLIFLWEKPGFGTGIRYPLPPGHCMTSSQDSDTYQSDADAPILFTQHNVPTHASAYLPAPKGQADSTTRTQATWLQDGMATTVEFVINEAIDKNGIASYSISWSEGTPSLAISFPLSEEISHDVVQMLVKEGVKAEITTAGKVAVGDDLERLRIPPDTKFLALWPFGRPFTGNFSYKPEKDEAVIEPVLILDRDRNVIAVSTYRVNR